jgi:hypothetical protein
MSIVRRTSELPIPADTAFELAQKIELFEFVVAPFIKIRGAEVPERIEPGIEVSARIWWFGVIPSWKHRIKLVRIGEGEIYTNEHGGPVRTWNHRLSFEPLGKNGCRYTDEIEVDDGPRGAGTRVFARLMFRHRHRRWAQLARILS